MFKHFAHKRASLDLTIGFKHYNTRNQNIEKNNNKLLTKISTLNSLVINTLKFSNGPLPRRVSQCVEKSQSFPSLQFNYCLNWRNRFGRCQHIKSQGGSYLEIQQFPLRFVML